MGDLITIQPAADLGSASARILASSGLVLADINACRALLEERGISMDRADMRQVCIDANNLRAQEIWKQRLLQRIVRKIDRCELLPARVNAVSAIVLGSTVLLASGLAFPARAAEGVPFENDPFGLVVASVLIAIIVVLGVRLCSDGDNHEP